MKIVISEIFKSIQGEGPNIGTPSVFVRVGGCNLRCTFCDTAYASFPENSGSWLTLDIDEVTKKIHEVRGNVYNLVITGGEPLLQQKALRELIGRVQSFFPSIEIETNGTILPLELIEIPNISYNVSVKLSNSGVKEGERIISDSLEFFSNYEKAYFKFVIDGENDMEEVLQIVKKYYIAPQRIFLMPLSNSSSQLEEKALKVVDLCLKYGFRYSDRLHYRLFGGERGK
ncbi:MAG: 7-carboxy-7-deazaguanine synthase QueE [candidate division WOR-3 bacterium]